MMDPDLILNPKERIRQLIHRGSHLELNESIPIKRYLRSAAEIFRMASVFLNENDLETALIYYTRFATLLIERLKEHPQYKLISKEENLSNQKHLKLALDNAEKIKRALEKRFEQEAELFKKEQEDLRKEQERKFAEFKKAKELAQNDKEISTNDEQFDKILNRVNKNEQKIPHFPTDEIYYPEILRNDVIKPSVPPRELKPSVDRSTKPNSIGHVSDSITHRSPYGLKNVIIPRTLIKQFLNLAELNTSLNKETCGILGGKLVNLSKIFEFHVTHVILPKQSGTSDSCQTEKEEEVFDYQDKHDLITIGWIHTHPTQTAFLSSVDLHTHCSYQLMLPEAVAVVCSPKYDDTGVFMLTPDVGLLEISNCRQVGFHPHDQNPPLFEVCSHVQFSDHQSLTVVDLR